MTYEEIKDALDGLSAYDCGATDSGIRNEALRQKVKDLIQGLEAKESRILIAKVIKGLFLTDAALEQGYGPEDVKDFLVWLDEEMACLV